MGRPLGINTTFKLENSSSVNNRVKNILSKVSSENKGIKLNFDLNNISFSELQNQMNKLQQEITRQSGKIGQTFSRTLDGANERLNQQIKNIENNFKKIGKDVQVEPIKDKFGQIIGAISKYENEAGKIIEKNYQVGKSFKEINEKGKAIQKLKLKIIDDSDLRNQNKALDLLEKERRKIEEVNKTKAKTTFKADGSGKITSGTITYADKNLGKTITQTYKLKTVTQELENTIKKTMTFERTGTSYTNNIQKNISQIEKYQNKLNSINQKNIGFGDNGKTSRFIKTMQEANVIMDKARSSSSGMTQQMSHNLDTLISKLKNENKIIKENTNAQNKENSMRRQSSKVITDYEIKINKLKNKYGELIKTSSLEKLRKDMANLAKSKNIDDYTQKLNNLKKAYANVENESKNAYKTQQAQNKANNSTNQPGLGSSFKQAMTKFPIWIGATTIYMGMINKIRESVGFISELDKAQTNISMITGMQTSKVKDLTKEYSNLASELHTTTSEMMSGSESYLRAGLKEDQVKGMLKASTIGSHISGQSTQDVSQQLITIGNGFRMAEKAKQSGEDYDKVMMHVVDTLSTLDDNSASSFANIATALSRTSSSAQNVGVSFEKISEYITVVSHITNKSAESIGESFKSIFARYRDIKLDKSVDEDGEIISNVEKVFDERANIKIRSSIGQFKKFSDVLEELKGKWKDLNQVDKSAITKALAGTRQAENFSVLMDNMDKLKGYDNAVQKGDGSAEKKNAKFNDSIGAKIADFKQTWQNLAQTIMSSDFLKNVINDVTYLVKWFDDLIKSGAGVKGSFLVLIPLALRMAKGFGLIATAVAGGQKLKFGQMMLTGLFGTMVDGEVKVLGLSGALGKLGTVMKAVFSPTTPYGWVFLGLAVAVGVGIHAFNEYRDKQKEIQKENDNLRKSQDNLNKSLAKGNTKKAEKDLKPLKDKQKELDKLYKKKKELEKKDKTMNFLGMKTKVKSGGLSVEDSSKLDKTKKEIKELEIQLKDTGHEVDKTTGKIKDLKNIESAIDKVKFAENTKKRKEEISTIVEQIDSYKTLSQSEENNVSKKEQLKELTKNLKGKIKGLKISTDEHGNSVIINSNLLDKNREKLIKEKKGIDDLIDARYKDSDVAIEQAFKKTEVCITLANKRIAKLKEEKAKLNDSYEENKKATIGDMIFHPFKFIENAKNARKVTDMNKEIKMQKNLIEENKKTHDALQAYREEVKNQKNQEPQNHTNPDKPDYRALDKGKDKDTKATNANTEANKRNTEAINKAKEVINC